VVRIRQQVTLIESRQKQEKKTRDPMYQNDSSDQGVASLRVSSNLRQRIMYKSDPLTAGCGLAEHL